MAMADPTRSGYLPCPCGAGICSLHTSKTLKNPGRHFYSCPAANRKCSFFKWLDQVQDHELIDVPLCACGAGVCRLDIKTTGPNAGCRFFACPIKKGQGACNYLVWLDAHANANANANAATGSQVDESVISPRSRLTNCSDVDPANSGLVDESGPNNLGQETESFLVDTSQCSEDVVPTSGLLKRDKIMWEDLKGSEYTMDEPLRKHCKRLRHGDCKDDGRPSGSSSICPAIPLANSRDYLTEEDGQASSLTSEMEIHLTQKEFRRQTTLAASEYSLPPHHPSPVQPINSVVVQETSWMLAAFHQNLSSQTQGWWGRLLFPPSRCLIEQVPKPFFCCIFPSFDPIFVPPNVDLLNDRSSATRLGSSLASKISRQSMPNLYEGARLLGTQSSFMRELASKEFAKVAEQLQNDLLTLLSSLHIQDHETMAQEADATFDSLNQLQIDHKIFRKQVKEFIRSASLLDKIDQSTKGDHSCQMLADHCNCEKLKLDEINNDYARTVDELSVSEQRAASLATEVSRLKDRLFQTEDELSCCEAESNALRACTSKTSKDKENFEQSYLSTCKKLEEARKLHKQLEAEQYAAKAAFEKAKVLLWG